MDDFKKQIQAMLRKSSEEAERQAALRSEGAAKFQARLLDFDRHADLAQEKVIAPRVTYLASLFPQASKLEMKEEDDYRHRINLHFGHTDEFPCTADVTFLIVHDEEPTHCNVKFEYLILPAYVSEKYRGSDSLRIKTGPDSLAKVAEFVEKSIQSFLEGYLMARRA